MRCVENDLRAALTAQTICASRKGLRNFTPFTPNTGRGEEVLKEFQTSFVKS